MSQAIEPAPHAFAVTPHDSNELAHAARALYVGTTGDVKVRTINGETVTFVGVPAGGYILVYCDLVYDTDTDASDIVALY